MKRINDLKQTIDAILIDSVNAWYKGSYDLITHTHAIGHISLYVYKNQ